MGFSELITRQEFDALFEEYTSIIRDSIQGVSQDFKHIIFSDSVVIISPSNSDDDLLSAVKIASDISYKFVTKMHLPTRGCISTGKISHSQRGSDAVIAGKPIVDAYRYEQQQDWLGIILCPNTLRANDSILEKIIPITTPTLENNIPDIQQDIEWNLLLKKHPIPLKGSSKESHKPFLEGYVIVPQLVDSDGCSKRDVKEAFSNLNKHLEEYLNILDRETLFATTPDVQRKYHNSKSFISTVMQNSNLILSRL